MKYYKFYQAMKAIWISTQHLVNSGWFDRDDFCFEVETVMREFFEEDD